MQQIVDETFISLCQKETIPLKYDSEVILSEISNINLTWTVLQWKQHTILLYWLTSLSLSDYFKLVF